ncbi:hypothetical protein [Brevundimonas sp.]
MTGYTDFIQERGTTRDCKSSRFSDSTYYDCSDNVQLCYSILLDNGTYGQTVNKAGVALIKLTRFSEFFGGQCFVPVMVWKEVGRSVISSLGGKRRLRVENPRLLDQLERTNRATLSGAALRTIALARFEAGLASIGGQADA